MNQAAFGYQYALTDYLEVQAGVSAIKYSFPMSVGASFGAVSYTHLTLPTKCEQCRSRWSPYH